ncbi:DinB family protein [Fulvivirga sp. M361]|uniref:DinB family protein n=1 Tax=Fulvivirga sp. M361 TaxID=2594266 RepID=UPI00117ACAAB|nr:DinB family protein [Fulvivirga sp. M361]TRX50456.1 DinB family protein [Fulvivirga sp. M361]
MKKIAVLLFMFPSLLMAQEESNVQDQIMGIVGFYANRVGQLAEAIPEEKYDWRPAEGIRSAGEAVMHVAQANYWLSIKWGPNYLLKSIL